MSRITTRIKYTTLDKKLKTEHANTVWRILLSSSLLSLTLLLVVFGFAPQDAFAKDSTVMQNWKNAAQSASSNPNYQAFGFALPSENLGNSSEATTASELPSKLDLRDRGVVTPVKLQDPWGTCWGFAAIAASETSILSEANKTYEETKLDLSERQLAWFTYSQTTEQQVGETQAGEGFHNTSKDANFGLNMGGFRTYASSVFASGSGPMLESDIPYQNNEFIKVCEVRKPTGNESDDISISTEYLTDSQIEKLKQEGAVITERTWAGNFMKQVDSTHYEHVYTTWKVDDSYRNSSVIELEHGYILPNTNKYNDEGYYQGVDWKAVEAIKRQMNDYGRGVIVSYNSNNTYTNKGYDAGTQWTHYTWDQTGTNHVVTIVGWDDNFSAKNFGDTTEHMPSGNGAWLAKNSWGSDTEDFPNKNSWGSLDDDGNMTGYFWISYYDMSLAGFESFDYDLNSYSDQDEYIIDQYDYLAARDALQWGYDQKVSTANIFKAEEDRAVRTLSCETFKPNTTVLYEVYLLDDNATSPTDADKPIIAKEDTYEYGGYHRTTLDESDWVLMREGQRYSVVVTQKCNDDGKYYAGVGYNETKPSEKEIQANREAKKIVIETNMHTGYYNEYLAKYMNEGMSYDEASAKAETDATAKIQTAECQETIESEADKEMDTIINCYFESRVNAGESWTSAPKDSSSDNNEDSDAGEGDGSDAGDAGNTGSAGNTNADANAGSSSELLTSADSEQSSTETEWTDWLEVKKSLEKEYVTWTLDNISIKAFAEIRDWASIDSLDELKSKIEEAEKFLSSVIISEDGSDVSADQIWMTQKEYDELKAAVAAAKEQLALAGESYSTKLVSTTPTQGSVDSAISSLNWTSKTGAYADASSKGTLAATGDASLALWILVLVLGVSSVVALKGFIEVLLEHQERIYKGNRIFSQIQLTDINF